jgi:urease accessory protein
LSGNPEPPRATAVIAADGAGGRAACDTVILEFAKRSGAGAIVTGVKGTSIEIALDRPVRLQTDDLLVLDDGRLVEVVAAPEALLEAHTRDPAALMRIAWHLGDRHIPAQFLANRIRVLRSPAVETLLASLGVAATLLEAPFEPEGGAYAAPHAHAHRGHDAHDHDHVHDAHCGHDHA